jgi:lauroyl/myristoyl acyltransferase
MNLQDLIAQPRVVNIGIGLGGRIPHRAGSGLARFVSGLISRVRPEVYWIVHSNIRQVLGPATPPTAVHEATRRAFYRTTLMYHDLFRSLRWSNEQVRATVHLPQQALSSFQTAQEAGRGLVIVSAHMGNFELGIQALGTYGYPLQALSLADPPPGFQVLNRVRETRGVQVTPITTASLRAALRRLRAGGLVITAGDRPVDPQAAKLLPFFGHPAWLPSGPVRLALKADTDILVGLCYFAPGGRYEIVTEPLLHLERSGDLEADVRHNMERVTRQLEGLIQRHPEQWLMFVPAWPELVVTR